MHELIADFEVKNSWRYFSILEKDVIEYIWFFFEILEIRILIFPLIKYVFCFGANGNLILQSNK